MHISVMGYKLLALLALVFEISKDVYLLPAVFSHHRLPDITILLHIEDQ